MRRIPQSPCPRLAAGILAILSLALSPLTAVPTPFDLGEFLVGANADSPLLLAPAGSILVLEAEKLEELGVTTVAEALAAIGGGMVNSNGPRGGVSTLSVRGSTSNQVLVILDGQRLNDARQGAPNLDQIPLESVERIELLSGGASAVYGADALGGVLVITTKRPSEARLNLKLENASYPTATGEGGSRSLADGQRLALEGSLPLGEGGLSFGASAERADNAYPYGGGALRDNADLLGASARLGLELPLAGGIARAKLSGSWQDAGSPGSLSMASVVARQNDVAVRGLLGWSTDALRDGALSLDLQADGAFLGLEYEDPDWPSLDETRSFGFQFRGNALATEGLAIGFGGAFSAERASGTSYDPLPANKAQRLSTGAYIAPTLELGRLTLAPAFRYDWNDDFQAGFTGMLGVNYRLQESLAIKLSSGSSYCSPSIMQLYYPYMSNPNLKAERGYNAELGLAVQSRMVKLEAMAFGRLVDDLILNDETWTPQNIGRAFIPGLSTNASLLVGPTRLSASYEFKYPLDLSGGLSLSEGVLIKKLSQHQLKLGAELTLGALEAGLSGRYWSERSAYSLPGVFLLDLRAAYALSGALSLSLAAENLLNEEYQVNAGYPMPGLKIVTGVSLKL